MKACFSLAILNDPLLSDLGLTDVETNPTSFPACLKLLLWLAAWEPDAASSGAELPASPCWPAGFESLVAGGIEDAEDLVSRSLIVNLSSACKLFLWAAPSGPGLLIVVPRTVSSPRPLPNKGLPPRMTGLLSEGN